MYEYNASVRDWKSVAEGIVLPSLPLPCFFWIAMIAKIQADQVLQPVQKPAKFPATDYCSGLNSKIQGLKNVPKLRASTLAPNAGKNLAKCGRNPPETRTLSLSVFHRLQVAASAIVLI